MNDCSRNPIKISPSFRNPFVVESPEKLSPQQMVNLFIERFTQLETVKQRKHTFIWGSRGSGKSMMLRYLEPQCQAIVHKSMENFLNQSEPFLAIYCPCKEGQFNKTELDLLNEYASLIITEHLMNLSIAERLIDCLKKLFPPNFFEKGECEKFAKRVLQLFDKASIASSLEQANAETSLEDNPLDWLQALFATENRKVSAFLRSNTLCGGGAIYEGATSGYYDFLLPLMKIVQNFTNLNSIPVYVLLDDADRLTKEQQSIINTWIANRDQAVFCLKVSAQREEYETFLTRDGGLIEQPHDYSEVDVDELYTRSKSDYSKKVKLIAERRLELSDVPTKNIEEFLPPDSTEEVLLEQFKKETAEEWEKVGKPGRRGDYVTRYATARLFQHLKATKKRKNYAGFQNMVHLSSGVVRDFLEPCYLMFDKCVSEGLDSKSIASISPRIQNDVLFKYSEGFVLQKFDDIRKGLPPERWTQVEALATLVASLGQLFYERLHDPEAREARLFSFTMRGQMPKNIDEVLRLGVIHRYFQLRTYSKKEGGGREKWYIFNRRVCPVFKLDPTGFEGRISLTPEFLRLACENPEKFVRMRLKRESQDEQQLTLFSLEEE